MLLQGKAKWAKIVGKPRPGYDKNKLQWSMDVYIDDGTMKMLRKEGLGDKIKSGEDGFFVSFKKNAKLADGSDAAPIRVVDHHGEDWGNKLIGNGSTVNVKFIVNEGEYKGKATKKMLMLAVQVWDHVEYEGKHEDDFPVREDGTEDWSSGEAA